MDLPHRPSNRPNKFVRRDSVLRGKKELIERLARQQARQNGADVGSLMHYIERLRDENSRRGQHSEEAQVLWKTIEEILNELDIRLEY